MLWKKSIKQFKLASPLLIQCMVIISKLASEVRHTHLQMRMRRFNQTNWSQRLMLKPDRLMLKENINLMAFAVNSLCCARWNGFK